MRNHYWSLDDGRIWSGGAAAYVAAEDPAYGAWLAAGHVPGRAPGEDGVADETALRAALIFYGLPTGELATAEDMAATIRAERDRRIAATDYLVMPDYPLAADKLEAVKVYRQALRDLPTQTGWPWGGDVAAAPWPTMPEM